MSGASHDARSEGSVLNVQCEQISHHPPISAAYYGCPERGIEAVCVDQITAKVSGMCEWPCPLQRVQLIVAVRVGPGPSNQGIFVKINRDGPGKGEVSQTHSRRGASTHM
jgi:hypothetical protein